jgi:zinc-ribbon domain/Bacterial PH domain
MIDRRAVELIKKELLPDESVEMTVKQRHFGPGGSLLTPTILIATNRRLILLYKTDVGFKVVHEIVTYNKLTTVRLERGVFSSTIHLHVLGVLDQVQMAGGKVEEEFTGFHHAEAEALVNLLNKKISKDAKDNSEMTEDYTYCMKCGAKVAQNYTFCPNCGARLSA